MRTEEPQATNMNKKYTHMLVKLAETAQQALHIQPIYTLHPVPAHHVLCRTTDGMNSMAGPQV